MEGDRCQVWVASAAELEPVRGSLEGLLSPTERAYVEGLREARAMSTLSRGLLRLLLAAYLKRPMDEVDIDRRCPACGRPHGKPLLRQPSPTTRMGMDFSVSHGGDRLVLAFSTRGPVGVDVESAAAADEVSSELLDFTLTEAERRRVVAAAPEQRRRVFLRLWTAKEACLKSIGTGLDLPLAAVALPPLPVTQPGNPAEVSQSARATITVSPDAPPVELSLTELALGPDYVGTLATRDRVVDLQLTRLSATRVQRWLAEVTGGDGYP